VTRVVDPVLQELRQTLLRMGSLAESILINALRAVRERAPSFLKRCGGTTWISTASTFSSKKKSAQEVDVLLIAKNLERVGDHATNIAEEVIFPSEARIVRHPDKLGGGSPRDEPDATAHTAPGVSPHGDSIFDLPTPKAPSCR
jgi:hypothetical protein